MLIWKTFVIIMFVTSLTLVNVNSSGEFSPSRLSRRLRRLSVNTSSSEVPSHASTPRLSRINSRNSSSADPSNAPPLPSSQRQPIGGSISLSSLNPQNYSRRSSQLELGSSSANLNYPNDEYTESNVPHYGTILLYNKEKKTTYHVLYNVNNPFNSGDFEHQCYSQIRVFCDTEQNNLESNHCIKRAIFYFKNDLLIKDEHDRYEYFLKVVRSFFYAFPLYAENVPFPLSFCRQKGIKAIQRSSEYQAIAHDQQILNERLNEFVTRCLGVLYQYQNFVPQEGPITQTDISVARFNIAHFALNFKTTLGMQGEQLTEIEYERLSELEPRLIIYDYEPEDLEYSYIYEIAQNVTSNDAAHKPSVYCRKIQMHYNNVIRNQVNSGEDDN